METALWLLAGIGLSVFFWMQVFSPSFRQKTGKPRFYFFKPRKCDLEDVEGVGIAIAIVAALLSSIITLFALLLIIVNWFKS